MKKYLMTGIAALALCAGFTSCSHDLDVPSQDEMNQKAAQNIVKTYEKAFKAYIGGEVAPNQDWGFGAGYSARTRSVNVNHNEWYQTGEGIDEIYGKLEVDPVVTNEERIGVFRYMNNANDKKLVENIDVKDYFVSQVWDGGTNYILDNEIYGVPTQRTDDNRKYTNELSNADGKIDRNNGVSLPERAEYTPLTTSYKRQDGVKVNVPGGDNMDWLFVNETGEGSLGTGTIDKNTGKITGAGGWTHINNFNSANNTDEWYAGKTWMKKPSGTYDFAYNQTDGSYFSHKYVIVSGNEVFKNNPEMKAKYGQYYYVCFDYEKPYTDAEKANEETFIWVTPYDRGAKQDRQKVQVKGYYTDDNMPSAEQMDAAVKALNPNYTSYETTGDEKPSVAGYLYGSQHFEGDDIYTDWIVRISPAKYKDEHGDEPTADLRVIAEDLSASDDTDFDFNDIVFDVYFGKDGANAKIKVICAGGTLPLRIRVGGTANKESRSDWTWKEVHKDVYDLPTNIMINTGAEAMFGSSRGRDGLGEKEVPLDYTVNSNAEANDIVIEVEKTVDGVKQWVEMKAEKGQPAAKLAVDQTFEPLTERQSIKGVHDKFVDWAQTGINSKWW